MYVATAVPFAARNTAYERLDHEVSPEPFIVSEPTNAVELLNYSLRKIIKNRSLFPNDEAVFKLLYLALKNIEKKWTMPIREWKRALRQFAIVFEGRMPLP